MRGDDLGDLADRHALVADVGRGALLAGEADRDP